MYLTVEHSIKTSSKGQPRAFFAVPGPPLARYVRTGTRSAVVHVVVTLDYCLNYLVARQRFYDRASE